MASCGVTVRMFQDDMVMFVVVYEYMLLLVICIYASNICFDGFDSLNIYSAPRPEKEIRRPKLWKTI